MTKSSRLTSLYPKQNFAQTHEGFSALFSNHNRYPFFKRQNRHPFFLPSLQNIQPNQKHFPSLLIAKSPPVLFVQFLLSSRQFEKPTLVLSSCLTFIAQGFDVSWVRTEGCMGEQAWACMATCRLAGSEGDVRSSFLACCS